MSYFGWLKNTMFPNKSATVMYIYIYIRSESLIYNYKYMYIPYKYMCEWFRSILLNYVYIYMQWKFPWKVLLVISLVIPIIRISQKTSIGWSWKGAALWPTHGVHPRHRPEPFWGTRDPASVWNPLTMVDPKKDTIPPQENYGKVIILWLNFSDNIITLANPIIIML